MTPPTIEQAAAIIVTNYPIGGPVFSGEQLLPWICARSVATSVTVTVPGTSLSGTTNTKVSGLNDDPVDDQCNTPSKLTYYYQPKAKAAAAPSPITGATRASDLDLNSPRRRPTSPISPTTAATR